MDLKNRFYPESKFGGFSDKDGTIQFYSRVNALINPSTTLLDFGCGRGAYAEDSIELRRNLRIFKGKVKRVIGLDVDRVGSRNPYLDEFYLLQDGEWPLEKETVDLCVCDSVLEHINNPGLFFGEASRVIRKGGYLCIRTPNLWGYPALISRLLPDQVHGRILVRIKNDLKTQDVFPTYYRCNSIPRLKRFLTLSSFDCVVYGYHAEPSYLSFTKFFYWLGLIYQRYAPSFIQPVLFAFARNQKV